MPTLNPWALLGALLVAIGLVFGGYAWGDSSRNTWWLAKTEKDQRLAVESALTTERENHAKTNAIIRQQVTDQAAINDRLHSDLIGLRNRPERTAGLPSAAGPGCKGATGAELSRPDSEFLSWEAARADEIRAGLIACYAVIDASKNGS